MPAVLECKWIMSSFSFASSCSFCNKEHLNLNVHERSKAVKWPEFSNGSGEVFGKSVGGLSSYMSQFDTKKIQ